MSALVVLPYDAAWPAQFRTLRDRIWPAVAPHALVVEHVGSTAVPGLPAKPIIDLDVVVLGQAGVLGAIQALGALGYEYRGELGIAGRHAFRAPAQDGPAHNLYVCPVGSLGLRNHLALRDYLRGHPLQAKEYGQLKLALAERFAHDPDGYLEGKTAWIVERLGKLGLNDAELAEIVQSNKRPD